MLADNLPAGVSEQGCAGDQRPAGRAGISPEKLPAPPPAEHPFSPTLLAKPRAWPHGRPEQEGCNSSSVTPRDQAAQSTCICISYVMYCKFPPRSRAEPKRMIPAARQTQRRTQRHRRVAQRGHPGSERRRSGAANPVVLLLSLGIAG